MLLEIMHLRQSSCSLVDSVSSAGQGPKLGVDKTFLDVHEPLPSYLATSKRAHMIKQ